jgi:L,D-peptidoglycan transpeptidase YkuD (ErfK/YbiS/YcfS/YnhG family)
VFAFGWAANPGTKLPYRLADNNSYWDENSGSPTYNRWVESNPGGDNEQLKNQPLYKYAMVRIFRRKLITISGRN